MRFIHTLNAGLWLLNGALWLGWAHVPMMAVVSFMASAGALLLARNSDAWDYR